MDKQNRHKIVRCQSCNKTMRSDNLKRHVRTHQDLLTMSDEDVVNELRARKATQVLREKRKQEIEELAQRENIPLDHCKGLTSPTTQLSIDLEDILMKDNQEYLEKIDLGNKVAAIIDKGVVKEESLRKEYGEALQLYRKQKPRMEIAEVELRPWQHNLMDIIDLARNDRRIFWISGAKGNEGKSWMQGYIEAYFGYSRVIRLGLSDKTSNILHTLSKRPLQTTDIFLFNDTRAIDTQEKNYAILELIKDGNAVSSKYNSQVLTFKTPNIVIIFSNYLPDIKKLSKDRWCIYTVGSDGLIMESLRHFPK